MLLINNKSARLYIFLAAFFIVNAVVAEFMGVKVFSLDDTLGWTPYVFNFFGQEIKGFNLTCGVILWPFVFVMTDIINEYFGMKGVRFISFIAAGLIAYAYIMLTLAMHSSPSSWWTYSSNYGTELDFNKAYIAVFGQGNNIIVGSLLAFLIGQVLDVFTFHWIKKKTGEKWIWLRSTGSTLVSQLIDSFVVLFYAFYIAKSGTAQQWSIQLVLAVCTVNYIYKFIMALAMTPVIYAVHEAIERYLGHDLAKQLKAEAAQ